MSGLQRAVVWFPHNLMPPETGAHHRCLSVLRSLRDLGWSTVLLSSERAHPRWTDSSRRDLTESLVRDVRVYELTRADWELAKLGARVADLRSKAGWPPVDSWAATPPGEQIWSRRQVESIGPDLMVSSYAQFDRLVPHFDFPSVQSMIDNLDIVSVSQARWARLAKHLQTDGSSRARSRTRSCPIPFSTRSRRLLRRAS